LRGSLLQHRQSDFQTVIGRQRRLDQRGQQRRALTSLFADGDLADHFGVLTAFVLRDYGRDQRPGKCAKSFMTLS
jgi:hypothetical protein